MAGWRHWLTKYTYKKGKFHNTATLISHNQQWYGKYHITYHYLHVETVV